MYEWSKIMGTPLDRLSIPLALRYKKGSVAGGTLHLLLDSSQALYVQHARDHIIDKINTYFGYRLVAALKIKQTFFPSKEEGDKKRRPLSTEEEENIKIKVSSVADTELREVLRNLGRTLAPFDK